MSSPSSSISPEAKVGIFVLVALVILGYMSFRVGQKGFSLRSGYRVEVVFNNAAGLERDASVQIAGVEMGRVESIALKDGKALVVLRIDPSVKLEKDVRATIKTSGILGDKYIELAPGSQASGYLEDGGRIAQVDRQADIDRLLNQVALIADDIKLVTGSLSTVLGGQAGQTSLSDILENTRRLTSNLNHVVESNEATVRAMLENTRQLTGNLNRVVSTNDDKVAAVLDSLKAASREMEKTFASLSEITEKVRQGEGTVGRLLTDRTTVEKLNQTIASLQSISDKINEGKGTIGKLVNDEETVDKLNEGLAGINRYVNKAEQFRTYLHYRAEYLFERREGKSFLDVRIQPKEDKFYVVGVVSDPRGKHKVTDRTVGGVTTRWEEWERDALLFNVQIGKRFRDLSIRGGLIESTGGVGLDYYLWNDRFRVTFEAFDFTTGRNAHLKTWGEYRLFKNLYLTAGWDDFLNTNTQSAFGGFAIRFDDEDLKYLLTTTPIPK